MAEMKKRKGLLERLREGPVLGDGGMTIGLERRGYAKVGVFTPESTVLHPDAGMDSRFVIHNKEYTVTFYS